MSSRERIRRLSLVTIGGSKGRASEVPIPSFGRGVVWRSFNEFWSLMAPFLQEGDCCCICESDDASRLDFTDFWKFEKSGEGLDGVLEKGE